MNITAQAKTALRKTTQAEFEQHMEEYDGFCLSCGEWSEGGVEPDAHDYECDNCGETAVCGAEDALLIWG
jgi:Zn finger protein HypA/HybF involved in hydrogenase expression